MSRAPRSRPLWPMARIREARGLSVHDVCSLCRTSPETVRALEHGDVYGLKLRTLVRLAAGLQVSPVDLVPGLNVVPAKPMRPWANAPRAKRGVGEAEGVNVSPSRSNGQNEPA